MSFYPTPRPMTVRGLSGGKAGTADTLREMVRLARAGSKDVTPFSVEIRSWSTPARRDNCVEQ